MQTTFKNYKYYFIYNFDAGRQTFLFLNYTRLILFVFWFIFICIFEFFDVEYFLLKGKPFCFWFSWSLFD